MASIAADLASGVIEEVTLMPADPRMLKTIPLFIGMDDDELAALAALMDEGQFKAGQVIFGAEQIGGNLYIIQAGQVELSIVDDDGEKVVLELMESGDFFGELSLLDGGNRSANAIATQRTDVLVLERHEFLDLLLSKPHMAQDVMVALAKRVRRTDNLLRRRVSRDPNEVIEERETIGERVADAVAKFGGSWKFIFSFAAVLCIWVLLNTLLPSSDQWDVYPFILLNLFLSMLAALQAPVIMMSQNRQDAKDRIRSELDYQVNLKAELGVTTLLHKADVLAETLDDIHARLVAAGNRRATNKA
jgi:CRP/FNR family transcriptional regulator, cyclic AMP receptor protein